MKRRERKRGLGVETVDLRLLLRQRDTVVVQKRENTCTSRASRYLQNKVAWIIGKQGSYVKQLQQKSGATIVVSTTTSKEYGRVWRYVQITGTGRALDRAKKLLHIRLERLEPEDIDEGAGVRL